MAQVVEISLATAGSIVWLARPLAVDRKMAAIMIQMTPVSPLPGPHLRLSCICGSACVSLGTATGFDATREDLFAEIGICPADPVRPGRAEYVKIYRVFQRFRGMRNIPRDYEDFSGPHDYLSLRQGELQRAFKDIGDLFILVAVQRHDATCAKYQPRQHALFTRDKLPFKERIQMLRWACLQGECVGRSTNLFSRLR